MKSCNLKILELFYNAKHTGRITKPDAIGRVGEDDEGLVIELTWRVIGGVIADAKFRAFGNPNAIAITSLMVDNLIGKSVDDALLIDENVIVDNLDEFKPEYLEAFDMVRSAISEAYNNYLKRKSRKEDLDEEVVDVAEYQLAIAQGEQEVDITKQIQLELQGTTKVERRGRPRKEVDDSAIVEAGEKRGRGRPRKEVDTNAIVEVGEKRGRGRPRKEKPETEEVEIGIKRGRGRPRKEVDPNAIVEVGEKRGRGRPRKEVDTNAIVEVGEKRGRGRPRKEKPETEEVETEVKRGRGRPRKEVDPNAIVEVGEKRGRGRPRKEVDTNAIVEVGEKRGRGRPKKEVKYNLPSDLDDVANDEELDELINGKPEIENNFVQDLITNKLIDEDDDAFDADYDLFKSNIRNIFSGKEVSSQSYGSVAHQTQTQVKEVEVAPQFKQEINTTFANFDMEDEQDIQFEEDDENFAKFEETKLDTKLNDDSFETNLDNEDEENDIEIENNDIIDEVEQAQVTETEVKRGRGRPRKEVDPNLVVEVGEKRGRGRPRKEKPETEEIENEEKRGRGRPKKIVIIQEETSEEEKRGRGRPRLNPLNSLTRSLTPNSMPAHNTQDIVFASKNVTTTNININVTKTTTNVEDEQVSTNDYTHSTTITSTKSEVEVAMPTSVAQQDEEIEIEPIKIEKNVNSFKDFDDEDDFDKDDNFDAEDDIDEDVDTSKIKDEAPSGGIEALLKALLDE